MVENCCPNFDPSDEDCRTCPGKVTVIQRDGTVDVLCRSGERFIRELIANSDVPTAENDLAVFPTRFPSPHHGNRSA